MRKRNKITSIYIASALLMIFTLLWLSISTPFVYSSELARKKEIKHFPNNQNKDCPLSNSTEEKSESSINTISEYITVQLHEQYPVALIINYHKCHSTGLYFEFHPQLNTPPPEV